MIDDLLKNYREQIDTLDAELLYMLHRRFELVKQVGLTKKEHKIQPLQTWRWNSVLTEKIKIWEDLWLSKEFIEDIWNRIHEEALDIEK